MKALNPNTIKTNYLKFAKTAAPILFIRNELHYHEALEMLEMLFSEAKDDDYELNGLIELISHAVSIYEGRKPAIASFLKKIDKENPEVSVLRLLMDQHNLGVADFPEIGDKSLISKILSGERNITKNHIKKLCERFSIEPGLFF